MVAEIPLVFGWISAGILVLYGSDMVRLCLDWPRIWPDYDRILLDSASCCLADGPIFVGRGSGSAEIRLGICSDCEILPYYLLRFTGTLFRFDGILLRIGNRLEICWPICWRRLGICDGLPDYGRIFVGIRILLRFCQLLPSGWPDIAGLFVGKLLLIHLYQQLILIIYW